MFSDRSDFEPEPNRLSQLAERLLADGEALLDLTESNPTLVGPLGEAEADEELLARAFSEASRAPYEPEAFGWIEARRAISESLKAEGLSCPPAQILLSSSTSEAYSMLFTLLCDPGDELLVPEPSYPLLAHLAQLQGLRLVSYPLEPAGAQGRWELDSARLWDLISDRSRAILAVSPNNPTGTVLDRAELQALGSLGLPLIVDEVFAGYPLELGDDRGATPSAIGLDSGLTFVLRGLSKQAALPQMKLAWTCLSGPPEALEEAIRRLELIADAFLSPSGPVQRALPTLLEVGERRRAALLERLRLNLGTLREALATGALQALSLPPVEGGWYAALRLPATLSDEQWAERLLREHRLRVHPGFFYDLPEDEAWLVISLILPPAELEEGLRRLGRAVAAEL